MQSDVQIPALERLPFSFVEPHAAGSGAAVEVKLKTMPDPIAEQQTPRFRTDQRALSRIVLEDRRVTLARAAVGLWMPVLPREISLQRDPEPTRRWAFINLEPWLDFPQLHCDIWINRAMHRFKATWLRLLY